MIRFVSNKGYFRKMDVTDSCQDYTGKVIHKKKRGFTTKKEALEWERDFLNKATADMGMLFQDFVELYFEDMSHRLKESTLISKHYMV